MSEDYTWADLAGDLPTHQDALMDGYQPVPSIAEQSRTHGAGRPAQDHGLDDHGKYVPGGAC